MNSRQNQSGSKAFELGRKMHAEAEKTFGGGTRQLTAEEFRALTKTGKMPLKEATKAKSGEWPGAPFDMGAKALKEATKADSGKIRVDLLSTPAILGLAQVLTFGAKKYADDNWRSGGGLAWRRVIGAAMRHLLAFSGGEDLDPESGLPHIDHLMCCAMFLSEYQKTGTGKDDRWRKSGREWARSVKGKEGKKK